MIGAPAFDNQQCGALCPILAVARASSDSWQLANYPCRSSKEKFQLHEKYQTVVALVSTLLSIACSLKPQSHPVDTVPIPANVRISEECSTLGKLMCGAVSMLSGDSAVERRSACIAYTEQNGRRVEQCGSVPASYPPPAPNVSSNPSEPTRTAHLSWKDNSADEADFRVYRIVHNQMSKIAELGPNTTSFVDKAAPPKACYIVVAFNSAGESPPTAKACLSD